MHEGIGSLDHLFFFLLSSTYSGYSGVDPNFHPWMVVWMCNAGKEMEEKRKEMHRFLSVTDRVLAHKVKTKKKTTYKFIPMTS